LVAGLAGREIGLNSIELHNLGNRHKINKKQNANKMSSVLIWQVPCTKCFLLIQFNILENINVEKKFWDRIAALDHKNSGNRKKVEYQVEIGASKIVRE
jgi:hypothetical protein